MSARVPDEVLADAVRLANEAMNLGTADDDMINARVALEEQDSDTLSGWAYIIIGYVTVAEREGRT